MSCCSQALISPKGKHFSKERQHARYYAKLPGQTLNGTTQEDAALRLPKNLPHPLYQERKKQITVVTGRWTYSQVRTGV